MLRATSRIAVLTQPSDSFESLSYNARNSRRADSIPRRVSVGADERVFSGTLVSGPIDCRRAPSSRLQNDLVETAGAGSMLTLEEPSEVFLRIVTQVTPESQE
jgi:hypothetical protein